MKSKKGFTLVELLAVIVILGIIMVIVSRSVVKNVNESKNRIKYMAAKEITEMAETYFAVETENIEADGCISVSVLIDKEYIESNTTNPATSKNGGDFSNQKICPSDEPVTEELEEDNCYYFNGYSYCILK